MHRDQQTATRSASTDRRATSASRWLVVAVALCGALAGGSIVEAIATLASRNSMPLSPDHLIAEPLALAGAICGGLLAGILASKDQGGDIRRGQATADPITTAEVAPSEPMLWQPAPHMLLVNEPFVPATETPTPSTRRKPRTRRAIQQHHVQRSRSMRTAFSHPPSLD
jgi:hypothetical protein